MGIPVLSTLSAPPVLVADLNEGGLSGRGLWPAPAAPGARGVSQLPRLVLRRLRATQAVSGPQSRPDVGTGSAWPLQPTSKNSGPALRGSNCERRLWKPGSQMELPGQINPSSKREQNAGLAPAPLSRVPALGGFVISRRSPHPLPPHRGGARRMDTQFQFLGLRTSSPCSRPAGRLARRAIRWVGPPPAFIPPIPFRLLRGSQAKVLEGSCWGQRSSEVRGEGHRGRQLRGLGPGDLLKSPKHQRAEGNGHPSLKDRVLRRREQMTILPWMTQTLNDSQTPASTSSSPGTSTLDVAYWVLSALAMFSCVCGITGNGLVVWLLGCRVRRTPCTTYVVHLAAADLLFLLCMASLLCLETLPQVRAQSVAYEVLRRVKYFAYTSGLSLLTAISTLRCLSVLFPVWYRSHHTQCLSTCVCAGLWALALVTNTLASIFCSNLWQAPRTPCFTVDLVLSALIMGIFTPVMTASSLILFVRVRRSSQRWRRRPTRLYVVILASVLVFLVCALPLGLYWFLLFWLRLQEQVVLLYSGLSRLSSAMSSSANPLIYFLVGSRRGAREPLGAVLRRALRDTPEADGREASICTSEVGG
ncbi:mas-related G-protein coupled receptor member D [Saccopteryx bilineata]|uniref:mas-related G-protein coupled receptor member D n=1 Tax=Saccopteryx bilineata TaxID=59482 RepID=UPI00338DAC86